MMVFALCRTSTNARHVTQRHRGGEIGEHAGFHAAAKAVGQHGDDAAFLLDFAGKKNIAGHDLPVLSPAGRNQRL